MNITDLVSKEDCLSINSNLAKDLMEIEGILNLKILNPCSIHDDYLIDLKTNNKVDELNLLTDNTFFKNWKYYKEQNYDAVIMSPPFKLISEYIKTALLVSDTVFIFEKIDLLLTEKRYHDLYKLGYLEQVYIYSHVPKIYKGSKYQSRMSLVWCWYKFNRNCKSSPEVSWIERKEKHS